MYIMLMRNLRPAYEFFPPLAHSRKYKIIHILFYANEINIFATRKILLIVENGSLKNDCVTIYH